MVEHRGCEDSISLLLFLLQQCCWCCYFDYNCYCSLDDPCDNLEDAVAAAAAATCRKEDDQDDPLTAGVVVVVVLDRQDGDNQKILEENGVSIDVVVTIDVDTDNPRALEVDVSLQQHPVHRIRA